MITPPCGLVPNCVIRKGNDASMSCKSDFKLKKVNNKIKSDAKNIFNLIKKMSNKYQFFKEK